VDNTLRVDAGDVAAGTDAEDGVVAVSAVGVDV
jgi:hypothetical protein